jgi:biotin operon repressor
MLDYSGNLLWGLQQMGETGVLDKIKALKECGYQWLIVQEHTWKTLMVGQ